MAQSLPTSTLAKPPNVFGVGIECSCVGSSPPLKSIEGDTSSIAVAQGIFLILVSERGFSCGSGGGIWITSIFQNMAHCTKLGGLPEKHSTSKVSGHAQSEPENHWCFVCLTINPSPEQIVLLAQILFELSPLGFLVRQSSADNDQFVSFSLILPSGTGNGLAW